MTWPWGLNLHSGVFDNKWGAANADAHLLDPYSYHCDGFTIQVYEIGKFFEIRNIVFIEIIVKGIRAERIRHQYNLIRIIGVFFWGAGKRNMGLSQSLDVFRFLIGLDMKFYRLLGITLRRHFLILLLCDFKHR